MSLLLWALLLLTGFLFSLLLLLFNLLILRSVCLDLGVVVVAEHLAVYRNHCVGPFELTEAQPHVVERYKSLRVQMLLGGLCDLLVARREVREDSAPRLALPPDVDGLAGRGVLLV